MKKFTLKSLLLAAAALTAGSAMAESMEVEGYKYALEVGEAHASGDVVTLKVEGEVVATLTYGEAGGADFAAAVADSHIEGYTASTGGNGTNGNAAGGTFYTIAPTVDATISVGVILNADKKFYIEEDGVALPEYDAMTVTDKYYGLYTFDATAGKSYKIYCAGSKLGFYGFEMEPIQSEEPEDEGMVVEGYKYALEVGEAHASGDVVTLKVEGEVVAKLTYGEAGGADFAAAVADSHIEGYTASTGGNGTNGNAAGGTFYTIAPTVDATISVGVILNADKKFYIEEDGVALPEYDAMTVTDKYYGLYTFDATAGKSYKIYCAGSKLGFYGFEMDVDGGTTGIETVETQAATGISYDLTGRRASDKGLMVRDGKVILVK